MLRHVVSCWSVSEHLRVVSMGSAFALLCPAAWSGSPTPVTSPPGFWLPVLLAPFLLCRAQSGNADSWLGYSIPHKISSFPHLPGP